MDGPVKKLLGDPAAIRTDHKYRWYLMRGIGRFHRLREWGRHVSEPLSNGGEPAAAEMSPYFSGISRDDVLAELRRDGLARGFDLPRSAVDEILAYAEATAFTANRDPALPSMRPAERAEVERTSGQRVFLGEYSRPWDCPAIEQIGRDPVVLDIAGAYLGTPPRLIASELWWSFAGRHDRASQNTAAQLFHFDLDDFGQLKLFFS